jgi:hypothetical protein
MPWTTDEVSFASGWADHLLSNAARYANTNENASDLNKDVLVAQHVKIQLAILQREIREARADQRALDRIAERVDRISTEEEQHGLRVRVVPPWSS